MISLLVGLAMAGEVRDDAWRQGFRDGNAAGAEDPSLRCGAAGFGVGMASAAVGTTLVGPCLAGPMILAGAVVPQIVAGSTMPAPVGFETQTRRYQRGYRSGYQRAALPRRWGLAALGGLSGAAVGSIGAYFVVGSVMKNQGFEPGPLIPD